MDAPLDNKSCHAAGCRFNDAGQCQFRAIEIDKDGRCIHFEERTPEHVREYLERRGLQPAEIERILQEVQHAPDS